MDYYVIVNEQQQGPFGLEQLADMGLTPETEVWAEGMADWKPAGEVPELMTYFSAFPAWIAYAESKQPGTVRPAAVPPLYAPQQPAPQPQGQEGGKSHKVLWGLLIAVAVVLLVMIVTCPDSQDHREAVTAATQGFVNDKVDEATGGDSDDVLSSLIKQGSKWFSGRAIDAFLDNNFQVSNYFLYSVGKIRFNGVEKTVSVGVLNHVFTFDKEDLAEAAAKVGKAEKEVEEQQQEQQQPDVQTLPSPDEDALSDEKQALDTIAKGVKEAVVNSAKDWINKKINRLTKQLPDTLP